MYASHLNFLNENNPKICAGDPEKSESEVK